MTVCSRVGLSTDHSSIRHVQHIGSVRGVLRVPVLIFAAGLIASVLAAPAAAGEAAGHTLLDYRKMSLRHERGLVKSEAELVRLVELTLAYGDQRAAAELLEEEMKTGRVKRSAKNMVRLGNMWLMVREWEKARRSYDATTTRSPSSQLDFKIAWTHFGQGNWKRAETHLHRALNKGGLEAPCRVRLLRGHTLSNRIFWPMALEEYVRSAQSKDCTLQGLRWANYVVVRPGWESERGQRARTGSETFLQHPVAGPALKICQTAPFELAEDEAARNAARDALMAAHLMRAPQPVREGLHDFGRFEPLFLRVLAWFNSGAEKRAGQDLDVTMKAGKRLLDRKRDEKTTALLSLLKSCAEMHMRRAELLGGARADIRKVETVTIEAGAKGG